MTIYGRIGYALQLLAVFIVLSTWQCAIPHAKVIQARAQTNDEFVSKVRACNHHDQQGCVAQGKSESIRGSPGGSIS